MASFRKIYYFTLVISLSFTIHLSYGREFAVPAPEDVLNKSDLPPLTFPGQKDVGLISGLDNKILDIRKNIADLKLATKVAAGAGGLVSLIPKAGSILRTTITTLGAYFGSVVKLEELKTDTKIQLGFDKDIVTNSLTLLKSEITPIRSRLNELLNPTTNISVKLLSLMPAINNCEKVTSLFDDANYVMSRYKPVFAPYLLTFISLYTTIAKLAVEMLPSKKLEFLTRDMATLRKLLNTYEAEVTANMLQHIVVYNDGAYSKKVCPKIKVSFTSSIYGVWDTRIAEWKSSTFNPSKSGCVLGDVNSKTKVNSTDVFHRGAIVFKNEISEDLFCGWANCLESLKAVYSERIQDLFQITRDLIFSKDNDSVCERDSLGRLVYTSGGSGDYGCHKGYCWAYCFLPLSVLKNWCYTSHTSQWQKCTRKEDCCPNWKCGGACWGY